RDRAGNRPSAPLGVDPPRPHRPTATTEPHPSRRHRHHQRPLPPQSMTPGERKAVGLYRAGTAEQLESLRGALPLHEWAQPSPEPPPRPRIHSATCSVISPIWEPSLATFSPAS